MVAGLFSGIGNALGGLFGGAASFGSALLSYEHNKKLQEQQYQNQRALNEQSAQLSLANSKEFTNYVNTEGYGQMRKGLESAGYNPLLAINASPSSSSMSVGSGSASGASVGMADPNAAANAYKAFTLDRKRNVADIENVNASTRATNASVSLIGEQAKTEQYRQKQMESETALANINKLLGDKQLSWYDKRQLMEIKTGYINAEANHLASEANQLNAHTAQANYRLQKGITDYENVQRKALADWYRSHPKQKGWTTGIGEWTGAFGNMFRGSYSFNRK